MHTCTCIRQWVACVQHFQLSQLSALLWQVRELDALDMGSAVVVVPFNRRQPTTKRFYSPTCSLYFAVNHSSRPIVPAAFQTQMPVFEDLCPGGRTQSVKPERAAHEVVIIPALKLIYIEIQKAASSTIRKLLDRFAPHHKRPNFFTCGGDVLHNGFENPLVQSLWFHKAAI